MAQIEITLNSFTEGANNFLSPDRIGTETAALIRDASVDDGVLVSIRNDFEVNGDSPLDFGHYGESNRSVVRQFGRYYWSYNDADESPYYGGDQMELGIPSPPHPPLIEKGNDETLTLKGSYRYCVTYVLNGYESAPGPAGEDYYNTVELAEEEYAKITVPEPPEGVRQVKIYRTAAEGADFYLIASLTRAEVYNPYEDKLSDLDLIFSAPMESLYYLPPPDGGKYLTESGSVFFLAVDDKLYFSEISNGHAWSPSNWISFDDAITGIAIEFQGLLVYTRNRVFRVTGYDALTIAQQEIPTQQGCSNWRTIATLSNAPLWVSNDGICVWDGQSIKLASYRRWKFPAGPYWAFTANDRYYLVSETGTVVYDLRAGGIFYELTIYGDYGWYDVDRDQVYYRRNEVYYQLEEGRAQRTSTYRSGLLGGNLPLTEFRKLRVSADSQVEYLLMDHRNRKIAEGIIYTADTAEVWLPTGFPTRGCYVELRFNGTLREILLSGWSMRK